MNLFPTIDTWYALGLAAIFVFGFLCASIVQHLFIQPMYRRRLFDQRMQEGQRKADLVRSKVFKVIKASQKSALVTILERVNGRNRIEKLQQELLQADIFWKVDVFLGMAGVLAVGGFLLGTLGGQYLEGAILGLLLGCLPFLVARLLKSRKANLVERQMPDAMGLLARSIRAGRTLVSAIDLASQETPAPLGIEMRLVFEETRLGISLPDALRHMVSRVDSKDLRYFVTALLIQNETGGNIIEIMEKIGNLIRSRLTAKMRVAISTAEGRFSAYILVLLPFGLFLLMYSIQKDYVMTLFRDPIGHMMLAGGLVSLLLGIISMKRLMKVNL